MTAKDEAGPKAPPAVAEDAEGRALQPAADLARRIDKAITDFTSGRACMHVPPQDTDVDIVLSECLKLANALESQALEIERLRMQPVACGVVALANTPESAAKARDMHPDYMSASCGDVIRTVDIQMQLRAELAALKSQPARVVLPERINIAGHLTVEQSYRASRHNACLDEVARLNQQPASAGEKCVHTEHCCKDHGCKYGDENCPVAHGEKLQSFPCEDCEQPVTAAPSAGSQEQGE